MKKQIVWGVLTLCGLASVALADIIYPANNGFEVTDITAVNALNRATYVSQTSTTLAPGWTLYGGGAGANLIALTANGWSELDDATNGNHDGTTSTYGQAMQFRGGDGNYGTNATAASAYISTSFSFAEAMTNVTVQFDYRIRSTAPDQIKAYIVASDNTVYDMGSKSQVTTDFVTFVSSGANVQSLAAGTYTLYLVGSVNNSSYNAFVDNVQINASAIPEPVTAGTLFLGAAILVTIRRLKN